MKWWVKWRSRRRYNRLVIPSLSDNSFGNGAVALNYKKGGILENIQF